MIAFLVLLGGCGGDSGDDGASTDATTTTPATAAAEPIVGEWERQTTCDELVQALRDAGMEELVAEFVAGNGFIPGVGVDDPELVDLEEPCKGAVPRVHSHFFTAGGGSALVTGTAQTWMTGAGGERRRAHHLEGVPGRDVRYRIDGDTITFEPLGIPPGCTNFRCGWSIAVAYPGRSWTQSGSPAGRPKKL